LAENAAKDKIASQTAVEQGSRFMVVASSGSVACCFVLCIQHQNVYEHGLSTDFAESNQEIRTFRNVYVQLNMLFILPTAKFGVLTRPERLTQSVPASALLFQVQRLQPET
jgi:hypothetical protein